MKRFMFGLMGLAVLGIAPALGQDYRPMALPSGVPAPGAVVPAACAQPAPGCCHGAECPDRHDYKCVPEQFTRKIPKTVHDCGCEPFCVAFPYGFRRKCACDGCEYTPRMRKFLIKAVETKEKCDVRCVPVHAPCCGGGSCPAGGCCTTGACSPAVASCPAGH